MPRIMLALAFWAICAVCGMAIAQDFVSTAPVAQPGDTMVDVNSWYALLQPYLTMIATTLITAAVAWLTAKIGQWTGLKIEGQHRDALQIALTNGAGLLIQDLGTKASTMQGLSIGNTAVAKAIDYVQKAVPDALAYFDIGPDSIAKKLEAKLGQMTPIGGTGPVPTQISGGLK